MIFSIGTKVILPDNSVGEVFCYDTGWYKVWIPTLRISKEYLGKDLKPYAVE